MCPAFTRSHVTDTQPLTKRQRYERLKSSMWTIRQGGGFDAHWLDIANVMAPRRVRFLTTERNQGDKRNRYIVDSTSRYALRTFQSGLHAGLTSPARPWFNLTVPDPKLAAFGPVKEWLFEVTSRMRTVFTRSNLYNGLPTVYGDFGAFGTGAMAVMDDPYDLFRCYTYPLGSYALGLNERGIVQTFAHEYELSVRQLVKRFGTKPGSTDIDWTNISDRVKTLWTRGDYEASVEVGWIVQPNDDYRASSPLARHKMFSSCHFEMATREDARSTDKMLRESGFDEFPVMAPRWEVTGNDCYGTDCPGMLALGDVRQLMAMQRDKGKLVKKAVDPPLKGPSSLRTQKPSLLPGDVTYLDTRQGQDSLAPIHEIRLEGFQHLSADIADIRYQIKRAFFEDLFLMMPSSDDQRESGQPITAREVAERHEEKMIALGPTLERTNDELLNPLIDRVYAQMDRAGFIPTPPPELQGVKLTVDYVSILAAAQKLLGINQIDRFVASTLPLIEFLPIVKHKLKGGPIVDGYADGSGIDPRFVASDEEAGKALEQEQQQQQALIEAQQAKDLAGAMATAGKAPIAPDSPLDRVMSGLG